MERKIIKRSNELQGERSTENKAHKLNNCACASTTELWEAFTSLRFASLHFTSTQSVFSSLAAQNL
jgi:hypothetical protein